MSKKTLLFFSRSELTYLYGNLDEHLKDSFNIIHVAYAQGEAEILRNQFGIDNVIIFKDLAKDFLINEPTSEKLEAIDKLLINQTNGSFNLNSALQSNRTSQCLTYRNTHIMAIMYYDTWSKIFSLSKIDFFVHEPVSLMMNQIAAAICKQQGGIYTTHIAVPVDGDSDYFIMVDHYNGVPVEVQRQYNKINIEDIENEKDKLNNYLKQFRSSYDIFFSTLGTGTTGIKFWMDIGTAIIKQKIRLAVKSDNFNPILDNIEFFLNTDDFNERRFSNARAYRNIKYDEPDSSETYYFYPLHLEPEAVVLYWADGLYTNQVKLIENIAAQLPPGVLLYVKDHPHLYGYRDVADYKRIKAIPNVKLLAPFIPGKKIINDCKGVITINGTGGFEALLLNKHVITFGSSYYSSCKRVIEIKNIKDLRSEIYALKDVVYQDDKELHSFLLAFLLSAKKGFTNYYAGMHKIRNKNLNENAIVVASGLESYFNNYAEPKEMFQ